MGHPNLMVQALIEWLQMHDPPLQLAHGSAGGGAQQGCLVECIETHISWVLLTPTHAYKLRKPVSLGFLDFSSLPQRLSDCQRELRINRRTAPGLYVGLVALRGQPDALRVEPVPLCDQPDPTQPPAPDDTLDYAVCMRRFEPGHRMDELWRAGQLSDALLDELTDTLVAFHRGCVVVPPVPEGLPARPGGLTDQADVVESNTDQLQQMQADGRGLPGRRARQTLQRHATWARQQAQALAPLMNRRQQQGFVRDVHGDLHLENLCLFEGRVTLFDALEFDDRLRCIDVMSDLAFLIMDLHARRAHRAARRVLNRYLEATGDYAGLARLRHDMVHRAMVRLKVGLLSAAQPGAPEPQAGAQPGPKHSPTPERYLALVERLMAPPRPMVILMHGLSGSGKTTVSQHLLEAVDACRVRSDTERVRLGLSGCHDAASTARVYEHLAELAQGIVQAGHRVIVDATFLARPERDRFRKLAQDCGVPLRIVHCEAGLDELRQRVRRRQQEGRDASEAGVEVLAEQVQHQDKLGEDEMPQVWRCEGGHIPLAALAEISRLSSCRRC